MEKKFKDIETQVLKKITPSEREKKHIEHVIEELKKRVQQEITKTKIPITIELVGSTAKDTYVRTGVDIDLFLLFPPTTPREILEKKGLSIGRALLEKQEECFAEHPYVRGMYQGVKTEIVPSYKIESADQKVSAVDRTPLHTSYVKQHLKEEQKKEVRLLKQFLKGIGCYGAEAEIEGFSGYLCEILIIRYKTFHRFLTSAQQWKYGEFESLEHGTFPAFETPLVFIDPVDENRNVASALSKEKFELCINAAQDYLKEPRLTFFFPRKIRPWSLARIKKQIGTKEFIGVTFKKPDIISENLYPQIRKAVRSITDLCEHYEFPIENASFHIDTTTVYIILQPKTTIVSKTIVHEGPPVSLTKNADDFVQKWEKNPRTTKKPFKENDRWYVEIKREYTDLKNLLDHELKSLSLGKHVDLSIRKGYAIVDKNGLLTKPLLLFWTMHLDHLLPWER